MAPAGMQVKDFVKVSKVQRQMIKKEKSLTTLSERLKLDASCIPEWLHVTNDEDAFDVLR